MVDSNWIVGLRFDLIPYPILLSINYESKEGKKEEQGAEGKCRRSDELKKDKNSKAPTYFKGSATEGDKTEIDKGRT